MSIIRGLIRGPAMLLALVALTTVLGGLDDARAQALQRAGGWPFGHASAPALDRDRDLCFLGSGGAVLVLDVSNPASPTQVAVAQASDVFDVSLQGDYA